MTPMGALSKVLFIGILLIGAGVVLHAYVSDPPHKEEVLDEKETRELLEDDSTQN